MSGRRLASGGLVDRDRPLCFTFDGARYQGCAGDTLASALIANGVRLVGRSFKRHRPRGILTAGPEEPNALLGVGGGDRFEPNTRATQVQLYDGLTAHSQNRWPSLRHDLFGALDRFAPLLPAGFYYKTFKAPLRAWPTYERVIRRLAGLGSPTRLPDPDDYEERHLHADLLVVGLGPAGLAAATAGARAGLRVVAVDDDWLPGGALLRTGCRIDGLDGAGFARRAIGELHDRGVRLLRQATAFGVYDHQLVGVVERLVQPGEPPADEAPSQRLWRIRAARIVVAAGAIERPLVFPHNDRPGIMLASAARTYVNRFGVVPGRRAVLVANNDGAYSGLAELHAAGIEIAAVVDLRPEAEVAPAAVALAGAAGRFAPGSGIAGLRGRHGISRVTLHGRGVDPGAEVDADLLLLAGGWTPSVHLHAHSRGKLDVGAGGAAAVADDRPLICVGACAGHASTEACWTDGWQAGAAAAMALGRSAPPPQAIQVDAADLVATGADAPLWGPIGNAAKAAFVDHQNDVTVADLRLAVHEGYSAVEHLKRYTTLGMGTDQGKTSNVAGLNLLADLRGDSQQQVGVTTYRPPYTPVTLSALAGGRTGARLSPARRTPAAEAMEALGAVFQTSGAWLRPRYFPRDGEDLKAAALREARTVRSIAGLYDASSLGKIEVKGPDAAAFLDALYAMPVATTKIGRARYALLLSEDGMVFDDGTVQRLAEDHFLATVSTARTEAVVRLFELYRDAAFPGLDFDLTDVTEQWATLVVAGPESRAVLEQALGTPIALPRQAVVESDLGGHRLRIARMSYSGENAYELSVPADRVDDLWRPLHRDVLAAGGACYGLEALEYLRIEKGHVSVGAEIDGRTTAGDLGLGRLLKPGTYIGSVAAARPALVRDDRLQLVSLIGVDGSDIPEGAALLPADYRGGTAEPLGHVTSAGQGVGIGASVALGLVAGGRGRSGEAMLAVSPTRGRTVRVKLGAPCAYDPEGARIAAG